MSGLRSIPLRSWDVVDDIIRQDILNHTSNSAVEIREYVRDKYGVTVAPMDVLRIKNAQRRATNVSDAQTRASERLAETEDITDELLEMYRDVIKDKTIKLSEKLMAMRDLRGWVKLAQEAVGDTQSASDNVFVIAEEWDLEFEPDEATR